MNELKTIETCNLLSKSDWNALSEMRDELQDTFLKKQIHRTETEMHVSVLNDMSFPTKAGKYWQSVREQAVYFENLVMLSFDFRRNEIEIKRLEKKIAESTDELDIAEYQIDLEECLYKKKNMEVSGKDRMRELKLWSGIKKDLDDGSFDTQDVNSHQLVSYTQRYLLETFNTMQTGAVLSGAEAKNLIGQTMTMVKRCEQKGVLPQALEALSPEQQNILMPKLGFQKAIND